MTTIAARIVRRPRRRYRCEECTRWISGAHLYAYGHADDGTAPFGIRICPACAVASATVTKDAKLAAAGRLLESEAAA